VQQQILQRNVRVSEIAIWLKSCHPLVQRMEREYSLSVTEGGQLDDGGACAAI